MVDEQRALLRALFECNFDIFRAVAPPQKRAKIAATEPVKDISLFSSRRVQNIAQLPADARRRIAAARKLQVFIGIDFASKLSY